MNAALPAPITGAPIAVVLDRAAARLQAAGIEGPRRDARVLLGESLRISRETIVGRPEQSVPPDCLVRFDAALARRCRHEPVSRIIGRREFRSLSLRIDPAVLDPRPDSETVVDTALELIGARGQAALRVLDLGTGSGCLMLALLSALPNATGVATDVSPAALLTARENARALGLAPRCRFVAAHWAAGLGGRFDIVIANPPYVRRGDIAWLAREVVDYEPRLALDGGSDGLAAYRALAPTLADLLAQNGLVLLEIGAEQVAPVSDLLHANRLAVTTIRQDLGGHDRCVVAKAATDREKRGWNEAAGGLRSVRG